MEGESNGNGESSDASSSLDHALLESLFYNEMLMMEDPADAMLAAAPDLNLAPVAEASVNAAAAAPPDPLGMPGSSVLPNPSENMMYAAGMNMNGAAVQQQTVAASAAAVPQPWPAVSSGFSPPQGMPAAAAVMPPTQPTSSEVPQERAQQLVSQFATLASRLGISLPPNVLSSLTVAAAANEAQTASLPPVAPISGEPVPRPASSSNNPPKVQALEITAEAAIAAVQETRKRNQDDAPAAASSSTTTTTANRPLYSKRRKKPRLSDCEAKLAALKSENEMLKRHLANVTNKAQVFDQERQQATEEMKRMIQEGAPPEKLNPVLHKFSEMYSDYGRHRHDELTFHLDQLEKLVAPTTFTKMGLWTLGQNEGFYTNPKRNPIAGILRKELAITPVQGRKILEQRQKIRDVCDNLKQCLVLLGKLKGICEHKQKIFHDRMSKCQEILTPIQVVKLLLWVDEHSPLLETVCPGWGSERIRPKEQAKPKAT